MKLLCECYKREQQRLNSFSFFDGVPADDIDDDDQSFVNLFVLPESLSEDNNNNDNGDNHDLPFYIEGQTEFEEAGEPRDYIQSNEESALNV